MHSKQKTVGKALFGAVVLTAIIWYLHGRNFAVLDSAGVIGSKERNLIIFASILSLVVVVPVFILLFSFAWRYREGNKKKHTYTPDEGGNRMLETIWWLVPTGLLVVLSIVIWQSSHQLDPYKSLSSNVKPVNVQVVAMDWKWLFIYPDEHVASINYLNLPINTPVNFTLTSDAPMNSFWIPQLGGQIYAMSGMSTQLHLMASRYGDYRGLSANISGAGFSGMKFNTHITSSDSYKSWLISVKDSSPSLDMTTYNQLTKPTQNDAPATYSLAKHDLYDTIIMKYMDPTMTGMQGMTQ